MERDDILAALKEYKRKSAEKFGILELGIFGSVARGESMEGSDLDICIKTATPNPLVLVHVKQDIENLLQRRIDIIRVRGKMNPFLKKRIEKESVYV